jgi:fructosamine-3-kinase
MATAGSDPLQDWLQLQLGAPLVRRTPVSGGSIHSAWRLELADGRTLFAKSDDGAALPRLQAEADGLAALTLAADGSGLLLPRPRALGRCGAQAMLVLDWLEIDGPAPAPGWRHVGQGLARLHRRSLEIACAEGDRSENGFGWPRDNVIGSTPQANGWLMDWGAFFRRRRLEPQLALLAGRGVRLAGSTALLERVEDWLAGHRPEPVLVHGDLWSGNAALSASGAGALFDPAVHRADREVDLAMAQLFGGFPASFFEGYGQEWPLPPGHRARVRLYNLYHLLNHANLFGGGYVAQAQASLEALLKHPPCG